MFDVSISEGKKALEPGQYDALLYAIVDLGEQEQQFKGQPRPPKREIKLLFQVPSLVDEDNNPRILSKKFRVAAGDKAALPKSLQNLKLIKSSAASEVSAFFNDEKALKGALGAPCTLNVAQFENDKKEVISYVESIASLHPKVDQPEPLLDPYLFSIANPDYKVFTESLTPFIRRTIMHALNCGDLPKEYHEFYTNEREREQQDKAASDGSIL